jgi:peptidyl-prolyl cis-trans isomerase C
MARSFGSSVIKQPLVQFLAVGLAIYLGLSWFAPKTESGRVFDLGRSGSSGEISKRIVVEREELLAFVQSRTQEPDLRATVRAFDGLAADQRELWIERFVREEALVREARMLGLDRNDELIRRRLVQKMEFLTLGVVEGERGVETSELEAFYRAHGPEYRIPAVLTFAHVFVRPNKGESDALSRARAVQLLETLNVSQGGFSDSLSLGDRFLYNRHYVDRTLNEIRSHFGDAMAERLAGLEPDAERWRGPMRSDHGWHLVLLTAIEQSRQPVLEEIVGSLQRDLEREQRERALEVGLGKIVSQYRVELGRGLAEGRVDDR